VEIILDERSYPEIAAELRCSENVIRKRVSRGLARLRPLLEEHS
jgi:RNA polymerase sigma-70 factor (ECF subfamily)